MEILVQTNRLTKHYGRHRAVNQANLSVRRGEIYGLIGRNGAGKTTILKLISGLATPTDGEISLFGQTGRDMVGMRKRIGLLIESPGVYPDMSAEDHVKLQCFAKGISDKGCVQELLEEVGLPDAGRKKVRHFSVGMKQRLGIALALVGNPELVILDEPINGLDPQGMAEIRGIIARLNKENNTTFIISSHILGELSKIATSYGIMDQGELKKQIAGEERTEELENYFFDLTGGMSNG